MGVSMQGPDYTQWHGFFEVAEDFYFKFLPQARHAAKGDPVVKAIAKCGSHGRTRLAQGHEPRGPAQIYPRCIGCRYCTNACPYAVKVQVANAEVARVDGTNDEPRRLRPAEGFVERCTFCHHRLMQARERARAEGRDLGPDDYVPACVQTCPAEAMVFGDLDDPHARVAELARSPRAFRGWRTWARTRR